MKFSSTLTILLVFIIAVVYATPIERREVGSQVRPLGVRFEGLYKQFNSQLEKVHKKFDHEIAQFNEQVPEVAKADGTSDEDLKWLLGWNEKYADLVSESKATSKKLDKSIQKLHDRLSA